MSDAVTPSKSPFSRWLGPAGWIAAGIVVISRVAVEPIRDLPHFDEKGMDAYSAVETYRLRKVDAPFETGIFGSSVCVWGIIPERVAQGMGRRPETFRKLATEGGTSFDIWNMVRRNGGRFDSMRLALVELNPRMLNENLEADPRLHIDISQHATHAEVMMLRHRKERLFFIGDEILPLHSFRRPLRTLMLNIADPGPGADYFPYSASRVEPFHDWHVPDPDSAVFHLRHPIEPATAAKRIAFHWRPSKLLDHSLREFLAWTRQRKIEVIVFQTPIHPEVADLILGNPETRAGYESYLRYLETLGLPAGRFFRTFKVGDCGIPDKGLRDHTHLNELGAQIYSRLLGEAARLILKEEEAGNSR